MGKITVQVLNQVLRRAGIEEQNLEILQCEAGRCRIRYQVDHLLSEKTFSTLPDLFRWVNAGWRPSYGTKLFSPLNENWVLIDADGQPGSEGLLFRNGSSWEFLSKEVETGALSEEIIRRARALLDPAELQQVFSSSRRDSKWFLQALDLLAKKKWSDAGLQAAPEKFRDFSFALEAGSESGQNLPEFLTPLHRVSLAAPRPVQVPWTDPFLFMEWQAFLLEAGVEFRQIGAAPETYLYSFKDLPLFRLTQGEDRWDFEFYSPLHAKVGEISLARPAPPKIELRRLVSQVPSYGVGINGLEIQAEFHLPGTVPLQEIEKFAASLGRALGEIPRPWLKFLLTGGPHERPLRILVSDVKTGVEKSLVAEHQTASSGVYYSHQNQIWIKWDDAQLRTELVFHEAGGHALSDFLAGDNTAFLTHPGESAVHRYYHWKLRQLFSKQELREYMDLSGRDRRWPKSEILSAAEEAKLAQYRERALQKFVSEYAVEGPSGIAVHGQRPEEDLAEAMAIFLECLNGRDPWISSRKKEPWLRLAGLHYLFSTFPVEQIRDIQRGEAFSSKAFLQVLGLALAEEKVSAVNPPARIHRQNSRKIFFSLFLDAWRVSPRREGVAEESWSPAFGIRLGWKNGDWGMGGTAAVSGLDQWNLGIWNRWSKDVASLRLFFEPGAGVGIGGSISSARGASLWLENRLGTAVFSNRLEITLQHRTPIAGKEASQWGIGVGWKLK